MGLDLCFKLINGSPTVFDTVRLLMRYLGNFPQLVSIHSRYASNLNMKAVSFFTHSVECF